MPHVTPTKRTCPPAGLLARSLLLPFPLCSCPNASELMTSRISLHPVRSELRTMPPFTFLKPPPRQSEQSEQIEQIEREDSGVSLENDSKQTKDVVQKRSSKRKFFRGLFKRSSLSSETRAERRGIDQFSVRNRSFPLTWDQFWRNCCHRAL